MNITENLLERIEDYCARERIAESTFGLRTAKDGKLVKEIRAGRSITLRMLDRIEAIICDEDAPIDGREASK